MFVLISLGLAGGAAAELLKWYGIRESLHEGLPDYAKTVVATRGGGGVAIAG